MTCSPTVVDWGALLEVIWTSLLAGIGVTAAFALAILGATRAVDLRPRGQRRRGGRLRVLIGASALRGRGGAVVFGIVVHDARSSQLGQPRRAPPRSTRRPPRRARTACPGRWRTTKPSLGQPLRLGLGVLGLPRDERRAPARRDA